MKLLNQKITAAVEENGQLTKGMDEQHKQSSKQSQDDHIRKREQSVFVGLQIIMNNGGQWW